MSYVKTTWKDRMVEKPLTFTQVTNADGTITLTPAEGTIVEAGTPVNASNMNNIETGIEELFQTYAKKEQAVFTQVTTQNGWFHTVDDPGEYFVDEFGIAHLRGALQPGILTNNTAIFTLPAGIRPLRPYDTLAKGANGTNLVIVSVRIDPTDGGFRIFGGVALTKIWLNDISFKAEV